MKYCISVKVCGSWFTEINIYYPYVLVKKIKEYLYLIELLSVSRTVLYSLLNSANHVKVEAHMASPPSHRSQFPIPNK